MRVIGDEHDLRDKPMWVHGRVRVLQDGDVRVKVEGYARPEESGTKYRVVGWIDKEGVT